MITPDYSFLFHHVDRDNCGQHDMYNGFLCCNGLSDGFADWQEENPGAIPIGVCPENTHNTSDDPLGQFLAMVYEDPDGNRYFVHVPRYWIEEARVADQGEQAMEDARWMFLWGHTKSELAAKRNGEAGEEKEGGAV